ncbi:MAG: hypothetical protein KC619_05560 [Myxococcales bacterium]|nr:hypothetical protein [Myxococcales bacterium]
MDTRVLSILALVAAGCTATIPDGQIVCTVASPDCPEGFTCCASGASGAYDGVCRRSACPASDAGSADAGYDGGVDAGFDAGVDAGPPIPVEVAAGAEHTCLRLSDGTVECWGSNGSGQLGQGVESTTPQTTPIAVMGLAPGALEIEVAHEASCARLADKIQCWGSNQVPLSSAPGPIGSDVMRSPVPRDVALGGSTPHQLAMGNYHACAIVGDARSLVCWGYNADGQLGIGTRTSSAVPAEVPGLSGVIDVCAAAEHTCAALDTGELYCWGHATHGQLGIGEPSAMTQRTSPERVALSDVVEVECGYLHTCAITDDGTTRQTWCWGENRRGETQQDELTSPVLEPTAFRDPRGGMITRIAIGGGTNLFTVTHGFTLIDGPTSRLAGFGENTDDQLGLGASAPDFSSLPLATVEVAETVIDVSAGGFHACAIDEPAGSARRVLCWGAGGRGRLGNASERGVDRPTPVFGYDGT